MQKQQVREAVEKGKKITVVSLTSQGNKEIVCRTVDKEGKVLEKGTYNGPDSPSYNPPD